MPETMEETAAKRDIGQYVLLKRNNLIFFALNLFLIVPRILKQYSPVGWVGAAVVLLLMFCLTVHKPEAGRPASRNLPLMGVLDVCILAVLSYQPLMDLLDPEMAEYILSDMEYSNLWFPLMLAALAGSVVLRRHLWLGGLCRAAAGACFIVVLFSDGALPWPYFYNDTEMFFVLYLLGAAGWLILCALAYYADPQSLSGSVWMSWVLLAALFLLCMTETLMIPSLAAAAEEYLFAISSVGLAWWKVLLAAAVLICGSIAVYGYSDHRMGPDSLVLGVMACCLLLLRVLISRYFIFSWVLFPVLLAGSFRCLYNEFRHTKTLRLISPVYLPVQLAALVLAVHLLKTGLWILAILICAYTVVFYATAGKNTTPGYRRFHWLTVLSCPAVLAVGYIWQRCFAVTSIILIGVMYAVFAFTILILNWPHPDKKEGSDVYRWVICGFMTLLCLVTVTRYGTKVQVTFLEEDSLAVITLEARGADNDVSSAAISWSSLTGGSSGREIALSAGENVVPIKDERLTIVVTDSYGITTTVTDWYPKWLLDE